MPGVVSHTNYINSASMLSSSDSWTNLERLVTRQLSEKAVSAISPFADEESGDGAIVVDVDLGLGGKYIGCVGALGHNLLGGAGSDGSIDVFGSVTTPGGSDVLLLTDDLSVAYLQHVGTPHHAWFFDVLQVRYLQFRFRGFTVPIAAGQLWAGPLLARGPAFTGKHEVSGCPPFDQKWSLIPTDGTKTSRSTGDQAYARAGVRTRSLRCSYPLLESEHVVAEPGVEDIQSVGERIGSSAPMLACARTDSMLLRHRHLVYGVQELPWSLGHSGGDRYTLEMFFKGEN